MQFKVLEDKLSTMPPAEARPRYQESTMLERFARHSGLVGPQPLSQAPTDQKVVSIVVGSQVKWYTWHREALQRHSPRLFASILADNINKHMPGSTPVAVLSDGDISDFDTIDDWLYPLKPRSVDRSDRFGYAIKNYSAGLKYGFEQLQNVAMDGICAICINIDNVQIDVLAKALLGADDLTSRLSLVDKSTNLLRDFLMVYMAYYLSEKPQDFDKLCQESREQFDGLFARLALIKGVMWMRHDVAEDPTLTSVCRWHSHRESPECD